VDDVEEVGESLHLVDDYSRTIGERLQLAGEE